MDLIRGIYLIILAYFVLGGIGFYLINRRRDPQVARKSYIKFAVYFVIINILYASIVVVPKAFNYSAVIIVCVGFYELYQLFRKCQYQNEVFFTLACLIYLVLSAGFISFSRLYDSRLILYAFLLISIFDSFSQISGQLWGKKLLFPNISPKKTLGGLTGGGIATILSAGLLRNLITINMISSMILVAGLIIFAFAGDVAASWYKRVFKAKDFSKLIPGHGGFLDRFDSLITAGAWVYLYTQFCIF